MMDGDHQHGLSVPDLGWAARELLGRAGRPLLPGLEGTDRMPVRYLRRQARHGLTVIYDANPRVASPRDIDPRSARFQPVSVRTMKAWAWGATRLVSVGVGERSLEGMRTRFDAGDVLSATVEVQPSGRVYAGVLDFAIDVFPVDLGMPALGTCCDPAEDTPLWEGLQAAARMQLGDESWRLRDVSVEPIRYKPGDRCVLLFHLMLRPASGSPAAALTVVGKLHAEPDQARFNSMVQERLYRDGHAGPNGRGDGRIGGSPLVPRPLAFIDELGLTLSEAVATQAGDDLPAAEEDELGPRRRSGQGAPFDPWRPRVMGASGDGLVEVAVPETELRRAAEALARLHTLEVAPYGVPQRPPIAEVEDVQRRAERIATANPDQADRVLRLGRQVSDRLAGSRPPAWRLVHGSYKPSQLLFQSGEARVIDWDEMVAGDPALDVGSFLAWLRPSGLWYGRRGSRAWFDASAEEFARAYIRAMRALSVDADEIPDILERARAYEASKLFKIAVRRVRWRNSPRPGELAAMCQEIAGCLEHPTRWREALASL